MSTIDEARKILAGCLFIPQEKIESEASINSLGELDSLSFELIVLEIEKVLGHDVDPMQLLEMRSVKDLAALLEQAS